VINRLVQRTKHVSGWLGKTSLVAAVVAAMMALESPGTPGGARRHDRPDSLYRALAADPAFQSVGAVRSGNRHLGSAVLIAPRWVLTDATRRVCPHGRANDPA
jgi:hypothetical protein